MPTKREILACLNLAELREAVESYELEVNRLQAKNPGGMGAEPPS